MGAAIAMSTLPAVDQFEGCLLGLALGDALGAAVEAFPPSEARAYAGALVETAAPATGPGGWVFGRVTDDTQLARELLLSIADLGGFDPAVFAARLAGFVRSGRLVGGGPATIGAARQLASGVAWHECGMPSPYAGNGAAMRAGPLGLLYRNDLRGLTRVAVDQARVTHHDSRAIAGAVALAGAVAIASRRAPVLAGAFLEELAEIVAPVDAGFSLTLRELIPLAELLPDTDAALRAWQALEPEARNGWQGISSFVVSSVCWSLYAFLRFPEQWWSAVRIAIAIGGDTDTLAAMTGAIGGARLGTRALPSALVRRLVDGDRPAAEDLQVLARRLHHLGHSGRLARP